MVLRKPGSKHHIPTSSSRAPKMYGKNSSPPDDRAQNGSDSDDWTLVTPPKSKSVSPDRQAPSVTEQESEQGRSISLDERVPEKTETKTKLNDDDPSDKFEEVALDDDDEINRLQEVKQTSSAAGQVSQIISQATKIEPQRNYSEKLPLAKNKSDPKQVSEPAPSKPDHANPAPKKSSQPQLPAAENSSKLRPTDSKDTSGSWFGDEEGIGWVLALTLIASLVYCVFSLVYMLTASEAGPNRSRASLKRILNRRDGAPNFVYLDPSDHAFSKLKLLDNELLECIQRQNPRHGIDYNPDLTDSTPRSKPIMGLVCYEKEAEWRKKFHKLKSEYNFDIWKTLKRVRNQLTNEMLEIYHPGLRFMLITNQLDWLKRLDSERRDREFERLKAEVHELRRAQIDTTKSRDVNTDGKLTARSASRVVNTQGQQVEKIQSNNNALVSLKAENTRLRVENEMLKQSLGEKAGTVYIRQSIELEKCKRDNDALRQFHLQVAHEVSKGLKEIDLQITDFGAILNEQEESLSARLNQTRGYLMRLVGETSQLAARNKSFETELNEARLLSALVVHEAQNLIQSDETSTITGDQELGVANATDKELSVSDGGSLSELAAEQLRELDSFRCTGSNDCLATKVNWLMKRAKLREKLRRAQSKLSDTATEDSRPACYTKNPGYQKHKMWKRPHKHEIRASSREASCESTY